MVRRTYPSDHVPLDLIGDDVRMEYLFKARLRNDRVPYVGSLGLDVNKIQQPAFLVTPSGVNCDRLTVRILLYILQGNAKCLVASM